MTIYIYIDDALKGIIESFVNTRKVKKLVDLVL